MRLGRLYDISSELRLCAWSHFCYIMYALPTSGSNLDCYMICERRDMYFGPPKVLVKQQHC